MPSKFRTENLILFIWSTLSLLPILFVSQTFAQSTNLDLINKKLNATEEFVVAKGYTRSHTFKTGKLNAGQAETTTLELEGGYSYSFIGVCDQDCTDVDMRILDENDNVLVSDTKDNNLPILDRSPLRTEKYKVKIEMVRCNANPCYYGVGVFSKLNSYLVQIFKQLEIQQKTVQARGFSKTHPYIFDHIDSEQKVRRSIELQSNTSYIFFGVCDEDCTDFDISIYDSNQNLILSDTKADDLPVVRFKPPRSATYIVELKMYKCKKNPCNVGVGVFGK